MEVLAKRLKWLREKSNLSQKSMAEKISMTVSGYQKIEYADRDPKLDVLVELAKTFNVTTDFLLGLSDETDELKEMVFEASGLLSKIDKINASEGEYKQGKYFVMEQMNELKMKQSKITSTLETKELTQSELANLKSELTYLDSKIELMDWRIKDYEQRVMEFNHLNYDLIKEYSFYVLRYIETMLEIPLSNANNSTFLKRHSPIKVGIAENLFETYAVTLIGKNINAHHGDFKTKEEAEKEKLKFEKFLSNVSKV